MAISNESKQLLTRNNFLHLKTLEQVTKIFDAKRCRSHYGNPHHSISAWSWLLLLCVCIKEGKREPPN